MSTVIGYLVGQIGEFSGARFAIPDKGLVIGRDPREADLVLDEGMVSRRHAQIAPAKDGKLYLIDLQSQNGTHLNGRRLTAPVALSAGDKIDFGGEGKAVFQFDSAEGAPLTGMLAQFFGEVAAPVEWQPGDTILDLYEVKKILGQGGMGKVYLVHHKSWNMDLVVKSPLPKIFENDEGKANFIREAETWVNLNLHPNICQCHYVRSIGGIPRIFAEYVPGDTLHHWIAQKKFTQLDEILDVAIQFAWGLHAAHEQGIVHQDVKPGNVLMTADGISKVSDFGLARARAVAGESTEAGQDLLVSVGGMTPAYCSPEQASGKKLTPKSDIWSWALSVLQIFTGGVVWRFGIEAPEVLARYERFFGPSFVVPIPKRLKKLLSHCFHLRPEDRPKDMLEIANELRAIYEQACGEPYPRPEPKAAEHLADSLNNRAVSMTDLGRGHEAEDLFRQALQVNPNHPEATYNCGMLGWRSGLDTDEELLSALRQVQASLPKNQTVLCLTGLAHLERGDADSAVEVLEQAHGLGHSAEVHLALAEAHSWVSKVPRCVRGFRGNSSDVISVALSSNCAWALSSSTDKSLRLWNVMTGGCVRVFKPYAETMATVALCGDGRWAVSGCEDQLVQLWETATGCCLRIFEGHTGGISSVAVCRNGRWALSGSEDGTLRLWECATGRCVQTFEGHSKGVTSVALSSDERFVLSASLDGTLRLWSLADVRCARIFEGHEGGVWGVAISSDGRLAVSSGYFMGNYMEPHKALRLWDVNTGECVRAFGADSIPMPPVALSADGRWALSGSIHSGLCLWETVSGRCLRSFQIPVKCLSLSQDNQCALVGSKAGELQLWRIATEDWPSRKPTAPAALCRVAGAIEVQKFGKQFAQLLRAAEQACVSASFAHCASLVEEARSLPGYDHSQRALDLSHRAGLHGVRRDLRGSWCSKTFKTEVLLLRSVAISCDGRRVLSGGTSLQLWDVGAGRCLRTFEGNRSHVRSVALAPDGQHAVSGGENHELLLWDAGAGRCLRAFEGHSGTIMSVVLSAGGLWTLSGSDDKTLRLWENESGRCLRTFVGPEYGVLTLALSADNRCVISGGEDRRLQLWDIATGRCLKTFEGHKRAVHSVVLAGNGRWALSGSADCTLRLWDVVTGRCLRVYEGHKSAVKSVAISPDGHWAISASWDRTLRLWELTRGHCVRIIEAHRDEVQTTVLSADCRWAVSGSWDETIRLWELDWKYDFPEQADSDEGARPYLESFLVLHTPYAVQLPTGRQPTEEEVTLALTRRGTPSWSAKDFEALLYTLGCAGYGWLRADGVRRELEKMAEDWGEPPPLW